MLHTLKAVRLIFSFLLCASLLAFAQAAIAQEKFYDRKSIPGKYTLGLYTTRDANSRVITLNKDNESFECFLGVTGDSTKVFSAIVFTLELPLGIQMDGPLRWSAIPGLKEISQSVEKGIQVEFNKSCQTQVGDKVLILARLEFIADEDFEDGEIKLGEHFQFGRSVELCDDSRNWPKPYAEAMNLTVKRKQSFWDKFTAMFN